MNVDHLLVRGFCGVLGALPQSIHSEDASSQGSSGRWH